MWRVVAWCGVVVLLAACGSSSSAPPGKIGPLVLYLKALPQGGAWVLTEQGLAITNDGGSAWTDVTPPSLKGESFPQHNLSAFVQDRSSAWMAWFATTSPAPSPATVSLYHTADGGATWTSLDLPLDIPSSETAGLSGSIFFLDETHGWLMARIATGSNFSRGALYRTADGGASWTEVSAPAGDPVVFATPLDGWMTAAPAESALFTTHDGGVTWELRQIPRPSPDELLYVTVATPHFFDPENGVLPLQVHATQTEVVDSLYFYVTNDGGSSWTQSGAPLQVPSAGDIFSGWLSGAALFDARNWYVLADKSYATHDAGHTWSAMKTRQPFSAYIVDFATPQDGWAYFQTGGCRRFKEDCYQEPHLIRTEDGGRTWNEVSVP